MFGIMFFILLYYWRALNVKNITSNFKILFDLYTPLIVGRGNSKIIEHLTCNGVGYGGGGRLGGGNEASALDGAETGLSANWPLLRGSPVMGKSDFRGAAAAGLEVDAGLAAKTTDPPSEA